MFKKPAILILIFSLVFEVIHSQDNFEILQTPADIEIHDIEINSNSDLFLGVDFLTGGGVLHRIDNSNIWDTSLFLNPGSIGTVHIGNLGEIYAADSKFFFSEDNGTNWAYVYTNQFFGILSIINTSSSSILFGTWGGIYKTDSIGSDWTLVLQLENIEKVNTIIEDTLNGILYAGSINYYDGGGVYISENGGNSWEHFGLLNHFVSSLALNSSGDLFAGTRGNTVGAGGVFKLANNHTNWEIVNSNELVTSMAINSEDVIFIGCSTLDFYSGGIRKSSDNGLTWNDISNVNMYDEDIEELTLGNEEYLYAISYPTYNLYKSINSTITSLDERFHTQQILAYNYPNPFNEQTTIYLSTPGNSSNSKVTVYDMFGKMLRIYNLRNHKTKNHSIIFRPKTKESGTYFYNVSTEDESITKKMIFIKE
nr:T9SS type A sorting domain-containing protein [Bacteroidota bacterium]